MQRLILIVLSAFFFLATPAFAKGSEAFWVVSQRSGDARVVRSGLQPVALTANAALAPGDIVRTGLTGRATLSRGSDYIVVAPRSELRLPSMPQPSGYTRVIQTLGTMLFKVRHTGVPHFAVDTPMLAAVVKGTTFTVVVDKDRSAVQVIEGVVQVTATDGGMQGLVEGGRTVFIDRTNPTQLIAADARTLGASSPSTAASVKINGSEGESLATVAALTSGLVRAEAVAAPKTESPAIVGAVVATAAATNDSGSLVQPTPGETVDASTAAAAPIIDTVSVVDAIAEPAVNTVAVVAPAVTPVVDAVVAPVVDTVVAPIVNTVVAPVVNTVVAPVVNTVVAPVVNTVIAPVVNAVVAPIVAPIVNAVVAPVVAPIVNTVVAPVVAPIVAPLAPVVAPIVAPLAPVIAPIVAPLAPVVAPIIGVIGSLFGH